MNLLAIFLGGGIGSVLRYLCSFACSKAACGVFPLGTFIINILGSLFLGFVLGVFMAKSHWNQNLKLFMTVGVAGGFTTFSTFSVETFDLIKSGHNYLGLIYPIASVFLGLVAVFVGFYLARSI
ncbi:MAG: fluoride efflux transporter CrcB [Candidatus Gastranaerophilales bacterium]|nr:fluoride efflux transporter CrcB [Candidatus Gastranaerophilales bacterium]